MLFSAASPPPPRFCSPLATLSQCGLACAAGYFCGANSLSPRANVCPAGSSCPPSTLSVTKPTVCPAGFFSAAGASVCSVCPAGRFGATANMSLPTCSGPCTTTTTSFCPVGSVSPAGVPCPSGNYSSGGAADSCTAPPPTSGGSSGSGGGSTTGTNGTAASGDRGVLMLLYSMWGGAYWANNLNWGVDSFGACAFAGVTCDPTGAVVGLTLVNNNVSGTLPNDLSRLTALTALNLAGNRLMGTVPMALAASSLLASVNLCGNNLTGTVPPSLSAPGMSVTLQACGGTCPPGGFCPQSWVGSTGIPCLGGYFCPAGTVALSTANVCPVGTYSALGQAACTPCPAGVYGSAAMLATPACSGPCVAAVNYECNVGATSATGTPCPAVSSCTGGVALCSATNAGECLTQVHVVCVCAWACSCVRSLRSRVGIASRKAGVIVQETEVKRRRRRLLMVVDMLIPFF